MTKLTKPIPTKRAYAVDKPDHLRAPSKLLAGQGTAAQRKAFRDKIGNRFPGIKEGNQNV